MVGVTVLLMGISFIMFFGFIAELIFKKTYIPDVLFLILFGFILGPSALGYISPEQLEDVAPLFTTFALFFLVYHGAFNIDIKSLVTSFKKTMSVMLYNFALSVAVIFAIMFFVTGDSAISLLAGFIMAGISSSFVMPVLKQLRLKGKIYSVLALESTFTDVFTIVFSLTLIELMVLGSFDAQAVAANFVSFFAIAAFVGIIGAVCWGLLVLRVFGEHRSYMMTIAFLILVYTITDLLGGSGVIAALFFGLILRNAKQLRTMADGLLSNGEEGKEYSNVVSNMERFFYSQISFFLKTFFFVYVGILLDFSDTFSLIVGFFIACALMATRYTTNFLAKEFEPMEKYLISSVFARGLAAAVIANEVLINNLPYAELLVNVTYSVIVFTIILSSINIFMTKRMFTEKEPGSTQA